MTVTVEIDDLEVRKQLASLFKKVGDVTSGSRPYVGLMSAIMFRDIIQHFETERGPDGPWQAWSDRYRAYRFNKIKKGALGVPKILQDTGRLRGGWVIGGKLQTGAEPPKVRKVAAGLLWFNDVEYGFKHQEGIGVPKRIFGWISNSAHEEMVRQTKLFIMDDRFATS